VKQKNREQRRGEEKRREERRAGYSGCLLGTGNYLERIRLWRRGHASCCKEACPLEGKGFLLGSTHSPPSCVNATFYSWGLLWMNGDECTNSSNPLIIFVVS